MSDAERVEEIRKRVRLRERFGYSEIGYNGKTVFDAKDVPYLLDRLTACREREETLQNNIVVMGKSNRRLRKALRACEENLRLIHEAAGPLPKDAPMPSHSTFGAWEAARQALSEGGRG